MKKINNILFLLLSLVCSVSFTACTDDNDTSLTVVTNLAYEPTMGGAIITFTAPNSNDLLYVKASYTNSLGEKVYRATSIYDNKIEIDGLADESKEYPVAVTAVDKWGGETAPTMINVRPGRSYISTIADNIEIQPLCGGLVITWENPMGLESAEDASANNNGKPVYVVLEYTDAQGVSRTRYLTSRMKNATAKVRGLFEGSYSVSYHIEDFSGNKTAQSAVQTIVVPAEAEFPKFTEAEDAQSGTLRTYIWTLVPKLTTLQEAWEYKNAAVFDGIVDSNTKNTQNYCGTDCDNSSVSYGSSIPWDTDQVDIVIDLHQVVSISRLKAWQRCYKYGDQPYSGGNQTNGTSDDYDYYQPDNLKRFKLFGSMTLNEEDWFLIKDCDIATNSTAGALPVYWTNPDYFGKEVYMPNNDSYAAAIEGHEWELDEMTAPVRYIRIRMVENWDTSKRGLSGMSEINLYGQQILTHEELKAQEAAGSRRK